MTTTTELVEQLGALRVAPGDTLMVHASMRKVGGRAEHLLDALEQAVGPEGRLMMLVCCPEQGPFDPVTSPAWDELGVLAEVFRTRPGVVLNAHPVARFGAWGADADALVRDPPLDDYYGPGSPLERLCRADGKVLRLGADEDTVTLLHYAEYLADVPDKRTIDRVVQVRGADGVTDVPLLCLDDETGIVDWPGPDYFMAILRAYLAQGHGHGGQVGGARAELLGARDLVGFGRRWMEQKLV